jgi:hypothetical protein
MMRHAAQAPRANVIERLRIGHNLVVENRSESVIRDFDRRIVNDAELGSMVNEEFLLWRYFSNRHARISFGQ